MTDETTLGDDRLRVLKDGEMFALFNRFGDIHERGSRTQGIYYCGTRFLSRFELSVDDKLPVLLSATTKDHNAVLTADLATPTDPRLVGEGLDADPVHILRSSFLLDHTCYSRIMLHNYSPKPVKHVLKVRFAADYVDLFEVRGFNRHKRGQVQPMVVETGTVVTGYLGLDGALRQTRISFSTAPSRLDDQSAEFDLALQPGTSFTVEVRIHCLQPTDPQLHPDPHPDYDGGFGALTEKMQRARKTACYITTSNEIFNQWLDRSFEDLQMLLTHTEFGRYPYAGTPWFSTPFGRDGIVTALECLWIDSSIAKGVLSFLAATQATDYDPARDAEPGKIIHEMRQGEVPDLSELPFGRYYGSADATPLFVFLAGAYFKRTGDLELIRTLWPSIQSALAWIETDGDKDQDGYVEYGRMAPSGLVHQGWKDSRDCIFHADGSSAVGPIALCEVQAYVYGAWTQAAMLAEALGLKQQAVTLREKAEDLKDRFDRDFWCDELGTYALALDGQKRPCRVRTSNAGQCLFSGIALPSRAVSVATQLLSDVGYSGWGIRTLAASERRFNPLSYHNGSVWPHDNALIALGFAAYGLQSHAAHILEGLYQASYNFDLHRLPELFCGFQKRAGEGPTLYPVACNPQAWAAGAVYLVLQASLGLVLNDKDSTVEFHSPVLPPCLDEVLLKHLRVGGGYVNLRLRRHEQDVSVDVLHAEGDIRQHIIKGNSHV